MTNPALNRLIKEPVVKIGTMRLRKRMQNEKLRYQISK